MGGSMHMSPRRFAGTPTTGAPYSAQRTTEHVQIGADGTRFTTNNQQETTYRDSQGRTRTQRPLMMPPPNGPSPAADVPLVIEISDPVANVGYTLDTQNRVAHRYVFEAMQQHVPPRPAAAAPGGGGGGGRGVVMGGVISADAITTGMIAAGPLPAAVANRSNRAGPEVHREDLGTQMIEGVLAKGERIVQTWPAGSQGNDRPFQTTFETWFSQDLKMIVLSRNSDPRNGENTMKLTNISLAEPSASLFAPPPDYSVVDETGPFEIRWASQRQQ
jgi:hypothetical protein